MYSFHVPLLPCQLLLLTIRLLVSSLPAHIPRKRRADKELYVHTHLSNAPCIYAIQYNFNLIARSFIGVASERIGRVATHRFFGWGSWGRHEILSYSI